MREADMNRKHLRRLVKAMYAVQDSPALDEYGSRIFGRPVRGTWKLFRYITKSAVGKIWGWNSDKERATYPNKAKVSTFDEFATFMLHEVTHGWCYFLKNDPSSLNYPTGVDEEEVCWDVSKLVCEMLGISYQEELANLCFQQYVRILARDDEGINRISKKLPAHLRT